MTTYVLVHDGDQSSDVWQEAAGHLRSAGHVVFCPIMSSFKKVTLDRNIQEVEGFVQEKEIDQCILVGHGYGSFVIAGVTQKISKKVAALVMIDGLVPKNGLSLVEVASIYGVDYESLGLTLDLGATSQMQIDEALIFDRPTTYVYCLKSEFSKVTKRVFKDIKRHYEDWPCVGLDAKHNCLSTHAKELALIFHGAGWNLL